MLSTCWACHQAKPSAHLDSSGFAMLPVTSHRWLAFDLPRSKLARPKASKLSEHFRDLFQGVPCQSIRHRGKRSNEVRLRMKRVVLVYVCSSLLPVVCLYLWFVRLFWQEGTNQNKTTWQKGTNQNKQTWQEGTKQKKQTCQEGSNQKKKQKERKSALGLFADLLTG